MKFKTQHRQWKRLPTETLRIHRQGNVTWVSSGRDTATNVMHHATVREAKHRMQFPYM